jgi:predicted nucleic acid-binding protein
VILVDTSIWIDHLRREDDGLKIRLGLGLVSTHPFVIGELALANLRQRATILDSLRELPAAPVASDKEVLAFIDSHALAGSGVGYIDAHLLASATLSNGGSLWTRDRRLRAVTVKLGLDTPDTA